MLVYSYSRKEALEEGLRDKLEINKDDFKRPILMISKRESKKSIQDTMRRYFSKFPASLILHKKMILGRDIKGNDEIALEDIDKLKDFKKKTVSVYVEKQHDNTYTLREYKVASLNVIKEIKIENGFYDIAGKIVNINLTKQNDKYTVNYIY